MNASATTETNDKGTARLEREKAQLIPEKSEGAKQISSPVKEKLLATDSDKKIQKKVKFDRVCFYYC
jgi:hypothetical protein